MTHYLLEALQLCSLVWIAVEIRRGKTKSPPPFIYGKPGK